MAKKSCGESAPWIVRCGEHKAVFLQKRKDGNFILTFTNRINPRDFREGEIRPRAIAFRRKKQLYTSVPLSKETAQGLKVLFNTHDGL